MVGRGSDLYQLCKDIDDTIKGTFVNWCVIVTEFVLTLHSSDEVQLLDVEYILHTVFR